MTRESDTSIKGPVRVEVANKINGDALISIHYNSYTNPEINGHWSPLLPLILPARTKACQASAAGACKTFRL